MPEYRTSIDIAAAPETVFQYLVTDAGMSSWMGEWAALDARPNGAFAVNIAGYSIRGAFLEVDAPRRVSVSWGVAGSNDLPPGSSTVSFELTPIGEGTRVDLVHSGLPAGDIAGHIEGWTHFLPRLQVVATGGRAGADEWTPDR